MDKSLRYLKTFSKIASYLFSTGVIHVAAVAELLCLIKRLEELHTKVCSMIKPSHLSRTLLFGMSRFWNLHINRCMDAYSLEDLVYPGVTVPFSLEPILLRLESSRYVEPIFSVALTELVSGQHTI